MDSSFEPLFAFLARSLVDFQKTFRRVPGSAVVERYVRSSHQNDPGRTFLEIILVIFVIRTLLQSRTRADRTGKHFIEFSEKEIDELVDEWTPEPLSTPLSDHKQAELDTVPVVSGPNGPKVKLANGKTVTNLASFNWIGLAGNEHIKERAVETLRKYGTGSCGPAGFYGTIDVHLELQRDLADFLGTEASMIYSQGFSTVSSVIPAFCKRGDIIVADRGVAFAIQRGVQISRSTIRWYDHNDLNSLEEVLISVEKECKRKKLPLTRRFIVTEGIFERDGAMTDLPKLVELKFKYKYRLILDETFSFGSVGRTGRGLTELYNVPASKIDMLIGSSAIGLASGGGFCAGSKHVIQHQHINSPASVFSASTPALLAVSSSEAINILRSTPSLLAALQDNVRTARSILDRVDCITVPSHPASPLIHIQIRQQSATLLHPSTAVTGHHKPSNPASPLPRDAPKPDWDAIEAEERLLQEVVDEALNQGVMLTKAKRLRGQEVSEAKPSIRLALTAALSRKETEKAVNIVKASLTKVLNKRK